MFALEFFATSCLIVKRTTVLVGIAMEGTKLVTTPTVKSCERVCVSMRVSVCKVRGRVTTAIPIEKGDNILEYSQE